MKVSFLIKLLVSCSAKLVCLSCGSRYVLVDCVEICRLEKY